MSTAWSRPSRNGQPAQQQLDRAHRPRKWVVTNSVASRRWTMAGPADAASRREIEALPVYWERRSQDDGTGTVTLGDATRTLLRGVSDLAVRAGELTRPDAESWYPVDSAYAAPNQRAGRAAATIGWPHRGSTVVRVVHRRCGDVVATIRSRRRWERLVVDRWIDPAQAFDVALSARGRLRIPWSLVPVPVVLRVTPFLGGRTLLELMVTSRGRFPRRFWSVGHDAVGAIARRCREP